jgi:hypothetical protein
MVTVLLGVASCSLLGTDRHFGGTYCLRHQDDNTRNASKFVGDYTVQHPRGQPFSGDGRFRLSISAIQCYQHHF